MMSMAPEDGFASFKVEITSVTKFMRIMLILVEIVSYACLGESAANHVGLTSSPAPGVSIKKAMFYETFNRPI